MITTFTCLEHYVEFIAGIRGPPSVPWDTSAHVIRLANYDVQAVRGLAQQTTNGIPYTTNQETLARRLCAVYTTQMSAHGVSPPSVDLKCALGVRKVNLTKSVTYVDNQMVVQFPFNKVHIEKMRDISENSQGTATWDKHTAKWTVSPTEQNILNVVKFSTECELRVSPDVAALHAEIANELTHKWAIELARSGDGFVIPNAATSLVDHINSKLGGFGADNFYRLVDAMPSLGVTVSKGIQLELEKDFSGIALSVITNRTTVVSVSSFLLSVERILVELLAWRRNIGTTAPILIFDPVGVLEKINMPDCNVQLGEVQIDTPDIIVLSEISVTTTVTPWLFLTTYSQMYHPVRLAKMQSANRILKVTYINENIPTRKRRS